MAPHALNASAAPEVPSGKASDAGSAVSGKGTSASVIKANPFGTTTDPYVLNETAYVSPATIINQAIYSVSSKIFSYETPGAESLLDAHLQLWAQSYQRQNSFGVVPFFHRLQVRSGASNALLGYYSKNGTGGQPLSVVSGSNALPYMYPTLYGKSANLPLSFNVSAIDFDKASNSIVSNYVSTLNVARSLGYPVVTPVDSRNGVELQHLAVLNHFLVSLTGNPSVYLFDGPEFSKTFSRFGNLLSVEKLGELYQNLLSSTNETPASVEKAVDLAFENLNKIAGTNYKQFEYVGHEQPQTVFVVYGSNESTEVSNVISKLANSSRVGLIKVRVPLPFNQAKFIESIPKSTEKLVVLGQVDGSSETSSNSLKADITAALFIGGVYHSLSIEEFTYPLNFTWTPITITKLLGEFLPNLDPALILGSNQSPVAESQITANTSPEGKYLIWGTDNSDFLDTANKLALSLSLDSSKYVSIRNKFDTINGGGSFQSQIVSTSSVSGLTSVDSADVILIENASLLKNFDILATAKPGAKVLLVNQKPIKNSLDEDVVAKLPTDFKRTLARNHNSLTVIDFSVIEELDKISDSTKGFSGDFLVQLAFWRAALPELNGFIVNKLLQANGNSFELLAVVLDKFIATVDETNGLKKVEVLPEWVDLQDAPAEEAQKEEEKKEAEEAEAEVEEPQPLPYFPVETSFFPNPRNGVDESDDAVSGGYVDLATKLTFPEAFQIKKDLRPDLPVKNFVVKVQENKRLTPTEYSRNIFHIEFDISGTGLTYDIGEALGIHGRNKPEVVEEFLKFYNVDGDSLVEVANKDFPSILEIRSARQILTDTTDFLGKPPKRFYESLAPFAEDEKEKEHLEKLAGSAGAEELKKRQDVDFCTYVDILDEFKSARPSFAELIKIISPIKRREYSIASSQRVHENAVHLLVVVVDWVDPKGRIRFGHTSKFLSDLSIGEELVVSVKPSVMKLPPLSTQPIVMSGLGTGLAPFKAFIEEKIWQQQQGLTIGDIYLFMGSRHKKEEYLYGELWEAYKDAGILTHIGAAFSRDQPQKIYIQDKILESIEQLTDAIVTKNGSFYLCGPTWPVPDITACLEDIVQNGAKKAGQVIKDVAKVVEDMKEEGRYILEVY